VFVDGEDLNPVGWTVGRVTTLNRITFGCLWSRTYQGDMDWDYFYVATGQELYPPVAAGWNITLDMDILPSDEGWISTVQEGNSVELCITSTVYLNMFDGTNNSLNFMKEGIVSFNDGVTVETRARLNRDIFGTYGPMGIYVENGEYWAIVSIGEDYVNVEHTRELDIYSWTDNGSFVASEWHVYRVVMKDSTVRVFVDGEDLNPVGWTVGRVTTLNRITFGCLWSMTYQGDMDWDYFYVATGQELYPPVAAGWNITLDMDILPSDEGWVKDVINEIELSAGSSSLFRFIGIDSGMILIVLFTSIGTLKRYTQRRSQRININRTE